MSLFRTLPWRDLLASLVLITAALIVLWQPLLRGEIFLPLDILPHLPPWRYSYERTPVSNAVASDLLLEYYPRRLVATRMLRQGQLPLWNPMILGGMPLLADGYSALLYPGTLLFLVLPVGVAFGWWAFLHLALAGLGAYWLARRLSLRPLCATFAGIAYQGNGFLMAWLLFPEFSAVAAWLPVALGCVERYEQLVDRAASPPRGRAPAGLSYALGCAVVLALCVLCQVQLAGYVGAAVTLYWITRRALTAPRTLSGALGMLSSVVALALLLSAVQWLPTLELARISQRVGSVGTMGSGVNLLQFVIPSAFGGPQPAGAPGTPGAIPVYPYAGLLPLALAALGAWRATTPSRAAVLVLALTTLGLTAMPAAVLHAVPLLNQLPATARWTMVLALPIALLAGAGLNELRIGQSRPPDERARLRELSQSLSLVTLLVLAAATFGHLRLLLPGSRYGHYMTLLRQTLSLVPLLILITSLCLSAVLLATVLLRVRVSPPVNRVLSALVLGLTALDLGWYGLPVQSSADPERLFVPTPDLLAATGHDAVQNGLNGDMVYPPTRTSTFLARDRELYRVLAADYPSFQPNLPSVFGIQDPRGYASLFNKRYLQFARAWEGKASDAPGWVQIYLVDAYKARRLLDLMGVRYVLFNPQSPNEQRYSGIKLLLRSDEGAIYHNPTALARAFLVHAAEMHADASALLARLTAVDFPVERIVLLEEPPPPLAPRPAGAVEHAVITRYTPTEIVVTVETASPAMLVLSDTLYPGWYASLDGQPTHIYAADLALRAVAVPTGAHTVVFRYQPRSVTIGSVLSVMGLVVVGAVSITRWRRSDV